LQRADPAYDPAIKGDRFGGVAAGLAWAGFVAHGEEPHGAEARD
jgi:hypothetical protein